MSEPASKGLFQSYPRALPLTGIAVLLTVLLLSLTGGNSDKTATQKVTAQAATTETQNTTNKTANSNKTALNRSAGEEIIRDYLISNPELLMEVQQALETKLA